MIFVIHLVGHELVGDAAGNHDVVFGAITLLAENRFERATTFEDEDDLIGAAVLVILVLAVGIFRASPPGSHVLVEQNRDAARVEIALAGNVRGLQMVMAQRTISD